MDVESVSPSVRFSIQAAASANSTVGDVVQEGCFFKHDPSDRGWFRNNPLDLHTLQSIIDV